MHEASCDPPRGTVSISTEYIDANEHAVKEQLRKAGVRLASVLDAALAR